MISSAQRTCMELKPFYLGKYAEENGRDVRQTLLVAQKEDQNAFKGTKIDSIIRSLSRFELINKILFRRVYNPVSNHIELRCAVPSGAASQFDFLGRGLTPLGYREKILLEYQNGTLGGHQGRERTMDNVSRDFWWPGMYGDVRR